MFRVDNPTAAVALPAPGATGTQGYFTDGVPGVTPRTILQSDFMNMVMLELINIVTAAGLTPSKVTYTQVRDAILTLIANGSAAGSYIQNVRTTSVATDTSTTNVAQTNTTPTTADGKELTALNTAFTPLYASSDVEIEVDLPVISSTVDATFLVFQGTTCIYARSYDADGAADAGGLSMKVVVPAGSTTSRTYSLRYGPYSGSNTTYIGSTAGSALFGSTRIASMTIREIRR